MENNTKVIDRQLTNSKFGKWGWSMIIYTFLLYYFWAGIGTDGLNVYPGAFSAMYGWDYNVLLAYATPAGVVGIIGGLVFGQLIMKMKTRLTSSITLICTGALYIVFGYVTTPMMYCVILSLFTFFSMGFGLIASATLMSSWFPRKKGIALGWATIGAPACTATFVAALSIMVGTMGPQKAFMVIGIIVVVFGIVSFFWVRNYPEEVGAYPDNIKGDTEELRASMAEIENYKSPFTIKRLLKDKDLWLISLGFGLLWMVTVGIVSQFVPRMISVGYDQPSALKLLTIASVIGCFGSYFWGWLDQKVGTKRATTIYSISYILALILLILQLNAVTTYIACIFVGLGIGGLLNLMPSMVISVYGRYDFMAANRLVAPIASVVRVFTFVIMAALLMVSHGSYTMPYAVFIGIDVVGAILLLMVTNKCKGRVD